MQETDIILLLYRIKVNIRKIENGDRESLDAVETDFLQLMELLKLFLISERETYYGYFLMNMSFKVDFKTDTIAGIVLNEYPPVFTSNPLLLCKFSLKEIIFIICHEIEHVILNHPAEMLKANPTKNPDIFMRFNYAADASVNDRLIHDINRYKLAYMSFPNGCIDSAEFANTFNLSNVRKNENYIYYFNLIKDIEQDSDEMMQMLMQALEEAMQNDEQDDSSGGSGSLSIPKEGEESEESGDGSDEAEGSGKEGEKSEKSNGKGQGNEESDSSESGSDGKEGDGQPNDGIVTAKNCNQVSTHQWDCGSDPEAAQELAKEFVNEAVEMMSSETRGTMPAGFMSQVALLNQPAKISWEKILKKYVGTITAGYRKTRTRLNRRQPERFDLSGKMEDKTLKIVVAIDTSGSVGDAEISRIFNEIFEILSKKKFELTIIECDARIQRVYKAKDRSEVKTTVRGRGGTAFTPVIEYINKDKYFRDAFLIYFTDGYGEYEIPKPRTYRNMWVILDDEKALSLKNPYGIVIGM